MLKIRLIPLLATAAVAVLVTGCGGGGGSASTGTGTNTGTSTTITGVAASGVAMSGATIDALCTGGNGTTTAAVDGSYALTLSAGVSAPCVLSATTTDSNSGLRAQYHSVLTGGTVANITPVTSLVAAKALGQDPSTITSGTLAAATSGLNAAAITSASALVQGALNTGLGLSLDLTANPLTSTTFSAALPDSGVSTNTQDMQLDRLMSALSMGKSGGVTTSVNHLVGAFTNPNTGASATAAAGALSTLASAAGIPTSGSASCPAAVSGPYVTARVGNTNLSGNRLNLGVLILNFGSTPLTVGGVSVPANAVFVSGGNSYALSTPDSTNAPCTFSATVGSVTMTVEVSAAGFIVASNMAPANTSVSPSALAVGRTDTNTINNWSAGNGDVLIGIPYQPGLTTADIVGTWNAMEWNLACDPSAANCAVNKGYVNWFRQFTVNAGSGPALTGTVVAHLNGIAQTGNTLVTETSSSTPTVQLCTILNDCPQIAGLSLDNVLDVVSNATTVMQVVCFKASNNDMIGIEVGNYLANLTEYFSETLGVILRPAARAALPPLNKTVSNPQWKLAYNNGEKLQVYQMAYTVTAVNAATGAAPASIARTFTDLADANNSDVVYMDQPYQGMLWRPHNASFKEMVGLRGNGWSVSGGTATFANQIANAPLPTGQGKFFAINIKR